MLTNKYSRWYCTIIDKAKAENRNKLKRSNINYVYYEAHHIIPECLGGVEKVLLTAREHFICHWLLIHMYHGRAKYQMKYALGLMRRCRKNYHQRNYSARQYEIAKKHQAEAQSYFRKGKQPSEAFIHKGKQPKSETFKEKMRQPKSEETKQRMREAAKLKCERFPPWNKGKLTAKHGSHTMYWRGCRCDLCRKGQNDRARKFREKKPEANREYQRRYWAKKSESQSEYNKRWYGEKKAKTPKKLRRQLVKSPEDQLEADREYARQRRTKNREVIREYQRQWQAKKKAQSYEMRWNINIPRGKEDENSKKKKKKEP